MNLTKKQLNQEIKKALKWLNDEKNDQEAQKSALLYAFNKTGIIVNKENIRNLSSDEVQKWSRSYREGLSNKDSVDSED